MTYWGLVRLPQFRIADISTGKAVDDGYRARVLDPCKKRYIHIYYSVAKAGGEHARLEEKIHEMQRFMEQHKDKEYEFGSAFHKYFHMHYNKENGHFVYGEPKLPVIQDELELCGYFVIISSEKMDAKDAINI